MVAGRATPYIFECHKIVGIPSPYWQIFVKKAKLEAKTPSIKKF